jgi:hypothetical protein
LWLDWPGRNRSSVSTLEGSFRHGRGEFYSRSDAGDGSERIERYAFSDITPFSLRWDDLHSADGGETWTKNWVMESSRIAADPEWPIADDRVPTFADGDRCDAETFRPYEEIVGHWAGDGVRIDAYRILDGCAVMAFLDAEATQEFLFLTYLGEAERWETQVLDARAGSALSRYHGAGVWSELATDDGDELTWTVDGRQLVYTRNGTTYTATRASDPGGR